MRLRSHVDAWQNLKAWFWYLKFRLMRLTGRRPLSKDAQKFLSDKYKKTWLLGMDSRALDPRFVCTMIEGQPDETFITKLTEDVYTFPFLTEEFCNFLIDGGEAVGKWKGYDDDPFKAPEIRLDQLTYELAFSFINGVILGLVNPIIGNLFDGFLVTDGECPFMIRYSKGTQTSMGLHCDGQGVVTLYVKLNNDFVGGGLEIPSKGWHDHKLPVGKAVIFPSGPSHMHRSRDMKVGVRYVLVTWLR